SEAPPARERTGQDRLARRVRLLERRVAAVDVAEQPAARPATAVPELRVGHVVAVLAHALRVLQERVLELLLLLGRELRPGRGEVLLASLDRLADVRVVAVEDAGAGAAAAEPEVAVRIDRRVGEVLHAVRAHALRGLQQGRLAV